MSLLIDSKFVTLVSHKLSRFTKKQNNLYNFRCPLCGDSEKNKSKKRGYIYEKNNELNYRCHNCGISTTLGNFIREIDPALYKRYIFERFKQGERRNENFSTKEPSFQFESPVFNTTELFRGLDCIADVDDCHYAKTWLLNRKIPRRFFPDLYFTLNFKKWVGEHNLHDIEEHKLDRLSDDPRIIIPFRDRSKNVTMVQGRALASNHLRYLTVKLEKTAPKIFGLERIDPMEHIYITEGPFDSMFIRNCLAVAGTDLSNHYPFTKTQTTILLDREPRNREIVKSVKKYIEDGFHVALFPDMLKGKDINDYVTAGWTTADLMRLIKQYSFSGLRAKLELAKWRIV